METNYTTENLFTEIQSIINELFEGKKSIFSITESVMILDMNYYKTCQVMKGLEEIGFYSFRPEEQLYMLLSINNIYVYGLTPLDIDRFSRLKIFGDINKGKNGLLDKGIIRFVAPESGTTERRYSRKDTTILSPTVCGKIFYGMADIISYETMAKQVEIIKASTIKKKELFFEDINKDDINRLYKLLSPTRYKEIMSRLIELGRKPAVSCLFYGAPGTGKTELAKQLARVTGRDIMIADVAKLHSSFTGDTEKNYRELFHGYRYLEKISKNAPILLFNEADGILGKRGDVMRQAIDKIANRIQNLLLQEMEDFEGIFIATTNLADNLDPAFERRLLYKIEFQKPGKQIRKEIWKTMLKNLNDKEAEILSSNYNFSGGQIENIATKRDIDYVIEGEEPGFETIIEYCDNEPINYKKATNKIGFKSIIGYSQ